MVLLRGFSRRPDWPTLADLYGLRGLAIADYPMYRGVAKLLGMEVLEVQARLREKIAIARQHWNDHDFFFLHIKATDSAGEDGDYDGKVALIEEIDEHIPELLDLAPDVLIVTGDHSTPSVLRSHSADPVPLVISAPHARPDAATRFGERSLVSGSLGPRLPATHILPIALGLAGRFERLGA